MLRGGLTQGNGESLKSVNPYGIAAISGMVGLFSKQASDKLREIFDHLFKTEAGQGDAARGDKLGRIVTAVMLQRSGMAVVVVGDKEEEVLLSSLRQLLEGGQGPSRVPVLQKDGRVHCVIHEGQLYRFLADHGAAATLTLKDLLDAPGQRAIAQGNLAFVPMNATLHDAQVAMEKVPGCRDVFVTDMGASSEPVRGWLPDTELLRGLTKMELEDTPAVG